jgi:hypothetical protein
VPSALDCLRLVPLTSPIQIRRLRSSASRTLAHHRRVVHYSQMPPTMWAPLFALARLHGLNMIRAYVLWNWHEAEQGQLDFSAKDETSTSSFDWQEGRACSCICASGPLRAAMCVQEDPAEIINTCNGFYCDTQSAGRTAFWTEIWNGWFQRRGEGVPIVPSRTRCSPSLASSCGVELFHAVRRHQLWSLGWRADDHHEL